MSSPSIKGLVSTSLGLLLAFSVGTSSATDKPNFLIIVADDMGWSDISPFGGEIRTPTLQRLADEGMSMSQFYVSPTCAPTRAMLLTGLDNHRAGVGVQMRNAAPNQLEYPHYAGQLLPEVVTIPEALSNQGYRSVMAGKWHLAMEREQWPHNRGFDRSYTLIEGGAGHFGDRQPIHLGNPVTYVENGEEVEIPDDFYSTTFYTDKLIEYIDDSDGDNKEAPFFAYLAYTAPHDPLQVPDEWLDRYSGEYDQGPDFIREQRLERLLKLGLLNEKPVLWEPPAFPSWLPVYKAPWAQRDEEEKTTDSRRMELYAAMVELMDSEIGRLLSHLDETGKLDNTYVLFFSDNGASALTPLFYPRNSREYLYEELDNSFENMGKPQSHTSQGTEWAVASSTPSKLYKAMPSEGGIRSPFIVRGPGVAASAWSNEIGHVKDIASTIYELAGINESGAGFDGKLSPEGDSILAAWHGEELPERTIVSELFGMQMVRQGSWKAHFIRPPFGTGGWQLYDIPKDPSEMTDLALDHPEKLAELVSIYDAWAIDQSVIIPEGRRSVTLDMFYDAPCGWWCSTKFGLAEMLRDFRSSE